MGSFRSFDLTKKYTVVVIAFSLFFLCMSTGFASEKTEDVKVVLHIEGMACERCAERVHTALHHFPGVENCVVKLKEKKAVVTLAEEVPPEKLIEVVENLGYKATLVKE